MAGILLASRAAVALALAVRLLVAADVMLSGLVEITLLLVIGHLASPPDENASTRGSGWSSGDRDDPFCQELEPSSGDATARNRALPSLRVGVRNKSLVRSRSQGSQEWL